MKTITIYNIKGGTGKTTTAKTVATGMAMGGKRVLLIDLDPQGNTGKSFIFQPDPMDLSVYENKPQQEKTECFITNYLSQKNDKTICDIFHDPNSIKEIIRSTDIERLDIIPSNLRLSLIDTKIRLSDGRQENYIAKALRLVKSQYDVCIIDCSPVKSLLTVNAIYASDIILIPITIDDDSKQGLAMTLREVKALEELYELDIDFRIVINMKQRTRIQDETVRYLRAIFNEKLLDTVLRYQSNPITLAALKRKTVLNMKESGIASDYRCLISEMEAFL